MLGVKCGALGGTLAHALASEVQAMGVVHEAVEDGVGDGWIGDHLVPMLHIDLAGYDRAAASVPILEDLQKVAALIGRRVGEPPVVRPSISKVGTLPSGLTAR